MSENDLSVTFDLNENNVAATYELTSPEEFDTLFNIESTLRVEGRGVINVNTVDGVAIVTSTTYTHEQGEASDTWIINHNLNKYPSVTIVDTAGSMFTAQVVYNNENTCTVYMNGASKGKAYLN